ncbi:hypothetical protein QTP86_034238 [Hemibagrus guttatus]|nr:hypothetical protein QTP86_034238 [Hemibagrus guttatus]
MGLDCLPWAGQLVVFLHKKGPDKKKKNNKGVFILIQKGPLWLQAFFTAKLQANLIVCWRASSLVARHQEIHPEYLKSLDVVGLSWLTRLCNIAWQSGTVPLDWVTGVVVPLFKKGDRRVCSNYRGITLLSLPGKVYSRVLERRVRPLVEPRLQEEQCGFRPSRGTLDQLYTLHRVLEGSWEFAQPVHMCFVDLEKAFDRVPRGILWEVLWEYGLRGPLLRAVRSLYNRSRSLVRIASCKSDLFPVHVGLRQGCPLSPVLFIVFMDRISRRSQGLEGVRFGDHRISSLIFADDVVLLASSGLDLQHALERFAAECEAAGMRVSTSKSEAMVLDRKKVACTLQVGGEVLPQVEEFKYLGVLFTSEGRMDREIDRRIGAAAAVMLSMYRSVVVKKELSQKAKLSIYQSIYVPTLTYGHELWVMTERVRSRIQAAEMSFLRRVAGRSLRDRVRSSVTREELGVEPLLFHIERGQLRWLGHLFRMPPGRLPGEVFRACPTGKRPRGRPRTRWRDYVFRLAWERLGVPPEELEEVSGERECHQGLGEASPGPLGGPRMGDTVYRKASATWHHKGGERPENRHVTHSNGCNIYLNVEGDRPSKRCQTRGSKSLGWGGELPAHLREEAPPDGNLPRSTIQEGKEKGSGHSGSTSQRQT